MTETFATPDDFGELHASELHSSLGERLGAEAGEAFMSGTRMIGRLSEYSAAQGIAPDFGGVAPPELSEQFNPFDRSLDMPMADAQARVKQEGLDSGPGAIKLPDQPTIRAPVLDLMIDDAHERRQYAAAVNRGPQGFVPGALGFLTRIGAGMIDPVNAAAFSIPVLGEARYGQILAGAGESILARGAVRAGVGAAQGAVGGAVTALPDWWLHTLDGQDYTMADALRSVVLSAGMGAAARGLHAAASDLFARIAGRPLEGAPSIAGTHLPEEALAAGGVEADLSEVPGISGAPPHPAEALADLPPGAREDVTRSAIADVVNGEPVRVGEMLQEAAKDDPRIAESIEAWHGSPHDFDRFDIEKIGEGEGAQSYGHGLYFAENERVARSYQRSTFLKDFIRRVQEAHDEFESPADAEAAINESPDFTPAQRELLAALKEDDYLGFDFPHQAVAAAVRDAKAYEMSDRTKAALENIGNVYRVRVAAEPHQFLDFDANARQQPEGLARAYERAGLDLSGATTGEDAYHQLAQRLGSPEAASRALREAGVPGIKYLDQGSRGMRSIEEQRATNEALKARLREPDLNPELRRTIEASVAKNEEELKQPRTRNYVVFDDKLVRITHKNGEEVGLDELKAATPANDVGEAPSVTREGAPGAGQEERAAGAGPDWKKLAERADPDPDLTEASRAADKAPDVASTEPAKAVSAAQAAAGEADKLLADILPKLSDDEREIFENALADLKDNEEARAQIVRDGAACLAGAIAGAAA